MKYKDQIRRIIKYKYNVTQFNYIENTLIYKSGFLTMLPKRQ